MAVVSCSPGRPVTVGILFESPWMLGHEALSASDESLVRRRALETLRDAFEGFDVRIVEGGAGDRLIRIEDTPFASTSRDYSTFGAAGVTYPAARVSSVRRDVLFNEELAALHCRDIAGCAKSREEVLEGLGQGVGATAAHELGHQRDFGFAVDSRCGDCYDGRSSSGAAHFFGELRWSDRALARMKVDLPVVEFPSL